MQLLLRSTLTTLLVLALVSIGGVAEAQESDADDATTTEALQQQIQDLQQQVADLRERLQNQRSQTNRALTQGIRIGQQLERGDRGEAVRRLQEMLATSEEIYPEGLTTGYFGPLTAEAVSRLQARLNLPSVGRVGPQTLDRINQLLEEGAGESGVIPPGLLKAPGIQRLLSGENDMEDDMDDEDTSTTTDDENGDDDEDEDEEEDDEMRGPDIDNLPISEDLKERLRNLFNSFSDEDDDTGTTTEDDDDDNDEDDDDDDNDEEDDEEDSEDTGTTTDDEDEE